MKTKIGMVIVLGLTVVSISSADMQLGRKSTRVPMADAVYEPSLVIPNYLKLKCEISNNGGFVLNYDDSNR